MQQPTGSQATALGSGPGRGPCWTTRCPPLRAGTRPTTTTSACESVILWVISVAKKPCFYRENHTAAFYPKFIAVLPATERCGVSRRQCRRRTPTGVRSLRTWQLLGPSSAPAHTRRGAMQSSSSTMTCATALWTVMGATARSCWPSTQLWRSQMLLKPTFSVFLFNLNLWFFCEYIYNIGNTSNFK